MKMNKAIIMLTVAVATLLSSCVGAEIVQRDETAIESEENKVTFSSSKSLYGEVTRVIGDKWTAGDEIGITMTDANTNALIGSYFNYRYKATTTDATSSFTKVDKDMFWPAGYSDAVFRAYYPYTATNTTGSVTINTYTDNKDYLFATAYDRRSGGVNLSFDHILAKVTVKLVAGTNSPDLTLSAMYLEGGYAKGTLDTYKGTITIDESYNTITAATLKSTGNANEYSAFILPQTLNSSGRLYVSLTSGSVSVDWSNVKFEAKSYTFTVIINRTGTEFSDATINSLTTEDGGSTTTTYY